MHFVLCGCFDIISLFFHDFDVREFVGIERNIDLLAVKEETVDGDIVETVIFIGAEQAYFRAVEAFRGENADIPESNIVNIAQDTGF